MAYNPAFHAYSGILNISFYVYSTIMDSFVIVCFYVEKNYTPQYSLTNQLALCLFRLMFWSR